VNSEEVLLLTGIDKSRLLLIEEGQQELSGDELLVLAK
jgi:hypothetical protein